MVDEAARKRFRSDSVQMVTCQGPVNIAVIKYWGKRNEQCILPLNSSLSVTLDKKELHSITTVAASENFSEDCLWLNGRKHNVAEMPRILKCLSRSKLCINECQPIGFARFDGKSVNCGLLVLVQARALNPCHRSQGSSALGTRMPISVMSVRKLSQDEYFQNGKGSEHRDRHIHICSENSFPTAAGLASSAAGYSCLVFALSRLFQVDGDLSTIARQGSGSACRSMYGGFVEWEKGEKDDGSDSVAKQIATEDHWLGLRVLILVVNEHKKGTSSTEGMRRSVETSDLLKFRSELCVPKRMDVMKKAISERDFKTFAETTMKESNQLHAVCQDTYPPITPPYMNQTSHGIVQLVTQYNNFYHEVKVAYTFDAGPNAFLFLMENDSTEVLALIRHFFPPETDAGFVQGIEIRPQATISKSLLESITIEPTQGGVKYIISTKAGSGPSELGQEHSLLDENGLPKL